MNKPELLAPAGSLEKARQLLDMEQMLYIWEHLTYHYVQE